MMGKKRKNTAQKTKEISVAMAEASSIGGEIQSNTPRKRGRPKKIVFQEEEKKEIQIHVAQKQDDDEDEERQKDLYPITEEVEEQTSLMAEKSESLKENHQPKSKPRRRKSKPHKSS